MRRALLFSIAFLAAAPLAAHDFWIDATSYRLAAPGRLPVRFLIGDAGATEPWETLWRKIVSLRSFGPAGVADQQAGIRIDGAVGGGGAMLRFDQPGSHLVAFESNPAENDLPADEFNAYAEHEGLTPALEKRRADGTSDTRGREFYSRRAKAIVQVGATPTPHATAVIGQTLEIVPERNPHGLSRGATLPLRVYYHGVPLAGASVVLEPLDGAGGHGTPRRTDAAGRVAFPVPRTGRWRAGVVWTQPIDHPRAEFETIFASLAFGF